jgi:hypothetical protein
MTSMSTSSEIHTRPRWKPREKRTTTIERRNGARVNDDMVEAAR